MKDAVRVILVDPGARSRQELQKLLGSARAVELIEVCNAYPTSLPRIAARSPDVVIAVADTDLEQTLSLVESVSRSHPKVAVVAAGTEVLGSVILRAVRAGAREFLPLPAQPIELNEVIRRVCPRGDDSETVGPRGPQVIAVAGAAGGVGCTSLAVNLATTLAKDSRRDVVLADFDLMFGILEECLSVSADHSTSVFAGNLETLDAGELKRGLIRHPSGLYLLPHPADMETAARLDTETLRQVVSLLRMSFSSIILDTSKGLQPTDFLAYEMADVILLVIQLNLNGIRNTVRLIQFLRQFEGIAEKVRLVVNRVNSPLSEISVKKAEELLKSPMSWHVPNATKLFRPARKQGVPIAEIEGGSGSKAEQAILAIAEALRPFPGEPKTARKRRFPAFR